MTAPPEAEILDAWYLVAGSDEVGRSRIHPSAIGARGLALGRTDRGELSAWSARCPHMGADLRAGWMVGESIVCPLHGMRFHADGRCDRSGVPPIEILPVAECCGAVFVAAGSRPQHLPVPERWPVDDFTWASARAFHVPVPWRTILVNAFDLHHLRAVHGRQLASDPVFEHPASDRLRMRYATRVIGRGISDRLTRALASDRIDIWLTCIGGTVLIVEVDLGRLRTVAVVGVLPDGSESWLRLSVGVGRGVLGPVRAAIARWLYVTFLRRDIPVLAGVSLQTRSDLPEDLPVQRLVSFLDQCRTL